MLVDKEEIVPMGVQRLSPLPGPTAFLPRPLRATRRAGTVLTLRDVRDVEALVLETLDETALPLTRRDMEDLVRCGIESVFRVERALYPGRPLLPVLDGLLRERLIDRWRSLHPEHVRSVAPAAA
jgi:hypothetical protein